MFNVHLYLFMLQLYHHSNRRNLSIIIDFYKFICLLLLIFNLILMIDRLNYIFILLMI
jgi:hypothetical protein